MDNIWTYYAIEFRFITKLCGSVPADPDLQKKWLAARMPKKPPEEHTPIEDMEREVAATTAGAAADTIDPEADDADEAESRLLVFQKQEGGLVTRMSTVRAHFKDCGGRLSQLYFPKPKSTKEGGDGEKSFNIRVLNGLYYPPSTYWLPILRQDNQKQIDKADGQVDKTIHVDTRMGPRNAFKSFQFVEGALLRFEVKVLTPASGRAVVSEKELNVLLDYGGTHGYGGERGDGEGRYEYTLKKLEK